VYLWGWSAPCRSPFCPIDSHGQLLWQNGQPRRPCYHGNKELTFLVVVVPRGLRIRIPERGLGPLCSLGTWWTHGKETITTSQGLGIRTPERGLGPLFSPVVELLLRDNVLIGWVLLFPTTWLVSFCKIPIGNSSTSSPFPLFSYRSVVAVLVWYFHWLGALMNLFHLWSNLYFEMLDASLILWFETYSVTLVHWFKKAHFSPKRLFLIRFAYIPEIYE